MKAVLHVKGYLDEPKPLNKAIPYFRNGREIIRRASRRGQGQGMRESASHVLRS